MKQVRDHRKRLRSDGWSPPGAARASPVLEDLLDFQFVDTFATSLVEEKILVHTAKAEAEIACGRGASVIVDGYGPRSRGLALAARGERPRFRASVR